MPEGWVIRAADEFWAAARQGGAACEVFPRDMETAARWAVRVPTVAVAELWLTAVQRRLQVYGIPHFFDSEDRRLYGCLVAYAGRALIFVEANDSEDERRYTVAHEVAHLIADYLEPRQLARERGGEAALEVLDGLRPPSEAERLRSLLAGFPLRPYIHLMNRHHGLPKEESRADRLALELLAPEDDTLARLAAAPEADPALVLRAAYGLPAKVAVRYAHWLAPPAATGSTALLLRALRPGFPTRPC